MSQSAASNANVVDAIFVALGLKTDDVSSGLRNMENTVKATMASIAKNVIAPVLSFAALKGAINEFQSSSVEMGKLAVATDMSMESLQAWRGAMADAGADADGFMSTINGVQKSLSEFGMNETKIALAQLGIDASSATDELFLQIADQMGKLTNQSAIQWGNRLGLDRDTIQVMRKGRAEMEALLATQKELGMRSEEDYKLADANRKAVGRLTRAWDQFTGSLTKGLFPAMTWGFTKLTDLLIYLQKHEVLVQGALLGILAIMTGRFLPMLLKVGKALKMLGVTPQMLLFAATVASIAFLLDDLLTYARGGKSEFAEFWSMFGTPEEVARGLQELKEDFKDFLKWLGEGGKEFLKLAAKIILVGAPILWIIGLLGKLLGPIFAVIKAFAGLGIVKGIGVMILGVIKTVGAAIWAFLATNPIGWIILAITAAVAAIIYFWDDLKEYFGDFFNWLGDLGGAIIGGIVSGVKKIGEVAGKVWDFFFGDDPEVKVDVPDPGDSNDQRNKPPYSREGGYGTWEDAQPKDWSDFHKGAAAMGDIVADHRQAERDGTPMPLMPPAVSALNPADVYNSGGNSESTTDIHIDEIKVVTNDIGDARAVAAGIRGGINDELGRNFVAPAMSGVNNK